MDTKDKNTEMIQRIIGALIAIRITTGGDYSEEIEWLRGLYDKLNQLNSEKLLRGLYDKLNGEK